MPRPPGALAAAPDGAVWAADANACQLYRVSGDQLERRPAPFITRALRFTPDGGLWLAGHTQLEHLSAAEVAAAVAAGTLRRHRAAAHAPGPPRRAAERADAAPARPAAAGRTKPVTCDAVVQRSGGGTAALVHRVLRRGRTLTLRLPARLATRPARASSSAARLTDADGNFGDLPITVKLGR